MDKTTFERIVNEIESALRGVTSDCIRYNDYYFRIYDREARTELIRRITEDYTATNGEPPVISLLERLADALLSEDLTDQSRSKVRTMKHAHLSQRQLKTRTSREVPLSTISGEISTIELTLIRYESDEERLKRQIETEYMHYKSLNETQPVLVRKAKPEELARIVPTPLYTRSRLDYEWSYDVRRRDGFTCQKCGRNRGKMHAHHIESYHANVELRTDLSNGVTLCDRCHFEFHDIYGRRYNTREQFNEWMRGDYYEL